MTRAATVIRTRAGRAVVQGVAVPVDKASIELADRFRDGLTGYTVLPTAILEDHAALAVWIRRSLDHAATLPSKNPTGGRPG